MKNLFVLLILCITFVAPIQSQTIDERIGEAMNNSEWRKLRNLYITEGEHIQTPYLKTLTKFFIFHFYNQPDSALFYGGELLDNYQSEVGESMPSVIYFIAEDLSRIGNNQNASTIMHQFNKSIVDAGGTPDINFVSIENQLRTLAECGGMTIERPKKDVTVPIRFFSSDRNDPTMMYVAGEVNGVPCDITYDTGAGANVLSPEFAKKINAHIAEYDGAELVGVDATDSQFAIVDSIKLGDITYRNVPFSIIDLATGHPEADKKLKELNIECIMGMRTMLPLKEVQFDFANNQLIIPVAQSTTPSFAPNFYINENNIIHLSVYDTLSNDTIEVNFDSGGALTKLTTKYYNKYKSQFADREPTDSVRIAGAGGFRIYKSYPLEWTYWIGDVMSTDKNVSVDAADEVTNTYDGLFGLPSFTSHDKVTLNFPQMWISLTPQVKLPIILGLKEN